MRARLLATGVLAALAMMGQTCAQHVRVHAYYNTYGEAMMLRTDDATVAPSIGCGAVGNLLVSVDFSTVPEWLNGDLTNASNTLPVSLAGQPWQTGTFLALQQTLTTGQQQEDYFIVAATALPNGDSVSIWPSIPPSLGAYTIVYSRPGCGTNVYPDVPAETASCHHPYQDAPGACSPAPRQTTVFVPLSDYDVLDTCEWNASCTMAAPSLDCSDGSCDPVCPGDAPYFMLIGPECCSCDLS